MKLIYILNNGTTAQWKLKATIEQEAIFEAKKFLSGMQWMLTNGDKFIAAE